MRKTEIIGGLLVIAFMMTVLPSALAANGPLTPVSVPYYSAEENPSGLYTVERVIDGIYGAGIRNMGVFNDDTPITADPYMYEVPITGHLVFDLGQNYDVQGSTIWARGDTNVDVSYLPDSVDFFYFADNDPTNIQGAIDDIEGDSNISLLWSGNLQNNGEGAAQYLSFTSPVNTSYVGMRVNTSFGWDSFQIGEQAILVPEEQLPVFLTPTTIVDHSGSEPDPYSADKMIDGIYGQSVDRNMAVMLDDTPQSADPYTPELPITGHVVFDLGQQESVSSLKIWSRGDTPLCYLPESMDVFYYADGDWSNNSVVDDIENDADIVAIWSGTLDEMGSGLSQVLDFSAAVDARYVGIRVNSSYLDAWDSFQIGEVAFGLGATSSLLPGDANEDGAVDVTDLGILATNYGSTTGKTWGEGDFTGDGAVNVSDLGILATHYGESQAVSSVPEPSVVMLLAGIVLPVILIRRR